MMSVTPNMVRNAAWVAFTLLLFGYTGSILAAISLTPLVNGGLGYGLTFTALLAMPTVRIGDVLSSIMLWLVGSELINWMVVRQIDIVHVSAVIAGAMAVALPNYARNIRRLAAKNGHMSFAEWRKHDRRKRAAVNPWRPVRTLHPQHNRPTPVLLTPGPASMDQE